MSSEMLWFLSRATGVVTVVLFTVVFVMGVLLAGQRRLSPTAQAVTMSMHRTLSLGMVVFLVAHIVSAVVDGFVPIGWFATLIPFTSGYERLWIGLGTLVVDVLLAVIVTSLLRHRVGRRAWRAVHLTTYAAWPVAILHGLEMGTDDQPLLRALTIACAAAGGAAIAARLVMRNKDAGRRHLARAKEWA